MTRIPSSAPAMNGGLLDGHEPIDVPRHQQRLLEARGDVRVEPACLGVRGNRLVVQTAVAAGVHQPGEQLRIVAVTVGLAEQADERSLCLTDVGLEVRVELVRDRQVRIELEGAAQGLLGTLLAIGRCRRCTCRSRGDSGRGAPMPERSPGPAPGSG